MRFFPVVISSVVLLLFSGSRPAGALELVGEAPLSGEELRSRVARDAKGAKHLGDGLVEIDDSSIENFIASHPQSLVLFYAFWCHWCKDLLPKYREASRMLNAKGAQLTLAQIDASRNLKAADLYDVRAYPTVTLFLDGVAHEYEGGRSAKEIVAWVESHIETDPVITTVTQLDQLLLASRQEPLLLARLPNETHHSTFHAASRHLDHVHFGNVGNDAVLQELQARGLVPNGTDTSNFVLLVNPHFDRSKNTAEEEPAGIVYPGDITDEAGIISFVKKYLFPAVVAFNYETAPFLLQDGRDLVILFTEGEPADEALKSLRTASADLRGEALFVVAGTDAASKRLQFALGINPADETFPSVRVLRNASEPQRRVKYRMPEDLELSGSAVRDFLRDVLAGRVSPWVKSEELPEEEPEHGEVRQLVAAEWERRVTNSTKDVLIKIYAPWCGHCKMLEPTYNEVARVLATVESVEVMRIDATRNELPITVSGYPTVILVTGASPGEREFHFYNGPRTTEAMVEWVAKTAGSPFDASRLGGGEQSNRENSAADEL